MRESDFTKYLSLPWKGKKENLKPSPAKDKAYYIKMIEDFFASIEVSRDNSTVQTDDKNMLMWYLRRGSTLTYISLDFRGDSPFFQLHAPLIYIPQSNILSLYRDCLEVNNQLHNCSLCVSDDIVNLGARRLLEGLEPGELSSMIHYFTGAADHLDNALAEKYGAKLCTDN
jgi:hypothetical protein